MTFTHDDLKRVVWTFVQAGAAVALVYGMGWLQGTGVRVARRPGGRDRGGHLGREEPRPQ